MRTSNVVESFFCRRRAVIFAVFSIVALMVIGPPDRAVAQAVYGSIFGTVSDSTGAVVENATVTVTDTSKGTSTVVRTDASGGYRAQHLIPDTYSVSVEANGFKKATASTIVVYADTAPKVDLQMVPGTTTESIVVTSEAPLLQAEHVDVNTILNERAVETLPNFNRNFTAFELLTPGTTYIGWNIDESQNPQRSQQIEVQGQLPFATGYELDGTDNQEPVLGVEVINPNLDAISEMKVTSQNYDAEFGKAVAGLVTAQTRSGSNNFHGSGFEYWRSDSLQARNPFTESVPDTKTGRFIPKTLHNQFGGSIGGPIVKDKVFFFGDYQGLRERTGTAVLTTVPTVLAKSTCTSGGDCDLSDYSAVSQIFDPATGQTDATTAGRTPFAGNIIPANRLSTPAVNLMKLIPDPNVTGAGIVNNYRAFGTAPFDTDQFDSRLDDHVSDKLHLFGRYTFFNSNLTGAPYFGAAGGPGFGAGTFAGTDHSRDQSLAAGGDYVVSQNWLTDFRFGWYKLFINLEGPDFNKPLGNQLGIPNANVGDLALNGGLPQFNIAIPGNGTNGGANLELGTSANQFDQHASQFQVVNNWTHIFGAHNVKFGADLRYGMNHIIGLDNNNVRSGNFHFSNDRTSGPTDVAVLPGLGLASFLLGDVSSFTRTQTQNTDAAERQKRMFYYVQDQWRVTSRFTLSYGVRWEIYFPESVNGKGRGGLLDLNSGNIRIAGYGPFGNNLNVRNSWDQFAPRIGIAYQVSPKTVVRTGYGRVFGQGWSGDSYGEVLTFAYPTQVTQNPNPDSQFASLFNLSQGPPGFPFAPIPANGLYRLPDGVGVPTRPTFVRLPTLDAWNLAIQHEITPSMSLEVAYIGSHGIHNMFDSSNQASPNTFTIAGFNKINPATGQPFTENERRPYFDGTAQSLLGVKFGAPYGWTQDLRYNANQATSSYNALEVRADKRFTNGLQFLSHFTWSKALTHESYYFFIDPRVGYGPSYYNRPKSFVFAGNYDLPFGRGKMVGANVSRWADRVIGGFSLNGALTWQSGLPWTPGFANPGAYNDVIGYLNRTGKGFHTAVGSFNKTTLQVPFFTPSPTPLGGTNCGPNMDQPCPTSFGAFALPAVGTFGNWGRDSVLGPGYINTDLSIAKAVALKESLNLQFRADFFNLFNHVNLGLPNSCVDCVGSGAGTISSTVASQDGSSMRRIMLSARIQF